MSSRGKVTGQSSLAKRGRIAFITTPMFRKTHPALIRRFIYEHLYSLCNSFEIITTGRTFQFIEKTITTHFGADATDLIRKDMNLRVVSKREMTLWREIILGGLTKMLPSVQGMIQVVYELVEGRLDAVIHLTDWNDMSAKPDSAVLWREANVHHVPIAHDIYTATAFVTAWSAKLQLNKSGARIFPAREQPESQPLEGLLPSDRVLGMVAHDEMKLELCCFAVENSVEIFRQFDYVLSTGTTGTWLRRFMDAAGRSPNDVSKIRMCLSGPYGGDVQIAYAVVNRLCQKVIFLQDPLMSHSHDTDIRLFEQAVLGSSVRVELATNVEGARLLVEEEGPSSNKPFHRTRRTTAHR